MRIARTRLCTTSDCTDSVLPGSRGVCASNGCTASRLCSTTLVSSEVGLERLVAWLVRAESGRIAKVLKAWKDERSEVELLLSRDNQVFLLGLEVR